MNKIKRMPIPSRDALVEQEYRKLARKLDEDDIFSMQFLLHGCNSQFLRNNKKFNIIGYDTLQLAEFLKKLFNSYDERLVMLRQLMFLIKRYDLLSECLQTCYHLEKERNLTYFDQYWISLFKVCEDLSDDILQKLKVKLGLTEYRNCEDVLFAWNKNCDQQSNNDKLRSLKSTLRLIGANQTAHLLPDQDAYPMMNYPCGIALIVNQTENRKGSEKDQVLMQKVLADLGFRVELMKDCGKEELECGLKLLAEQDHSIYDCFMCVIMAHGKNGYFKTSDYLYSLDDLKIRFNGKNAPSLKDKPKLFFIQACQVNSEHENPQSDAVGQIQPDSTIASDSINTHNMADMYMLCATVPGEYAYRDEGIGSFFIQTLAHLLKNCCTLDIKEIGTKLKNEVSNIQIKMKNKKEVILQMPYEYSTLRFKVYFGERLKNKFNY